MTIKTLASALMVFAATGAHAQSSVMSVSQITAKVLKAANGYANSISCVDIGATSKDIFALVPYKNDENRDEAAYGVFWVGDVGCAGGSGTVSSNIALVKIGAGDSFYVDPLKSSPAIKIDFPVRGFERIVGNTKNSIVVDAAEYGPDDANCCPTQRYRYTLRADEKGGWRLVEKRQLPKKRN